MGRLTAPRRAIVRDVDRGLDLREWHSLPVPESETPSWHFLRIQRSDDERRAVCGVDLSSSRTAMEYREFPEEEACRDCAELICHVLSAAAALVAAIPSDDDSRVQRRLARDAIRLARELAPLAYLNDLEQVGSALNSDDAEQLERAKGLMRLGVRALANSGICR